MNYHNSPYGPVGVLRLLDLHALASGLLPLEAGGRLVCQISPPCRYRMIIIDEAGVLSSANLPPGVGVDATVPADMWARSVQWTPPCVSAPV